MASVYDVALDVFKNSLPYLLMSRSLHPGVGLVLVPVVLFLVDRAVKYLRSLSRNKEYSQVFGDAAKQEYDFCNYPMQAIAWYLRNVMGFTACEYVNVEWKDDIGDNGESDKPRYVIDNVYSDSPVLFKGVPIRIGAERRKDGTGYCRTLTLSVPVKHKDVIKQFINEAISYYRQNSETVRERRRQLVRKVCVPNAAGWVTSNIQITKNFDNIFLDESLKQDLIKDLEMFKANRDLYIRDGIPRKRGYLFYGPPGVGKSSLYYAIADWFKADIYKLSLSRITSVSQLMTLVSQIVSNSVVIIDDIDRMNISNKAEVISIEDNKSVTITLQTLLEIFDGYEYFHECIIVFTTNHIDQLDDALIRPGRIDRKYLIELPTTSVIASIFRYFYRIDVATMISRDLLDGCRLSTADLINTIILPHRDDAQAAVDVLRRRLRHNKQE